MQKVCLYLEKLALVQHRPDARQSELTDVVVTDISLLRLPPALVRPYEYLVNAEVPSLVRLPQTTVFCHTGFLAQFESVTLIIHFSHREGEAQNLLIKLCEACGFTDVFGSLLGPLREVPQDTVGFSKVFKQVLQWANKGDNTNQNKFFSCISYILIDLQSIWKLN